jgi:hypothetical protein
MMRLQHTPSGHPRSFLVSKVPGTAVRARWPRTRLSRGSWATLGVLASFGRRGWVGRMLAAAVQTVGVRRDVREAWGRNFAAFP